MWSYFFVEVMSFLLGFVGGWLLTKVVLNVREFLLNGGWLHVGWIAGAWLLVGGIVGAWSFWRDVFCRNKNWLNDRYNLAVYKRGKSSVCFADLRKHFLFKKCDLALNTYYWKKIRDGSLFYTTVGPEDEFGTLQEIVRTIMLEERMIDDFFGCLLISYVTNENEKTMDTTLNGNCVEYSDYKGDRVVVKSGDFYESMKGDELDSNTRAIAPKLSLEHLGVKWIFDAYHGSNLNEIAHKLKQHKKRFSTDHVFVFASGSSVSDQFVAKMLGVSRFDFKLYTLDANGKVVNYKGEIKLGPLIPISATRLSKEYCTEFANFSEEVYYWLRCKKEGRIIQRVE